MLIPGLVSITFRELPPERIVALCVEAGLRSIEWGGDVHVPHGDLAAAARVGQLTTASGLEVSAYGSYYRAAVSQSQGLTFDSACKTALALGAPIVRVWAGNMGSSEADSSTRCAIITDLASACDRAAADGIGVALEFHAGTLCDRPEAALQLVNAIARPNLTTYWQPPNGVEQDECARGLRFMLEHVQNVHVFHWWPDHEHRLPLEAGAPRWREYFRLLSQTAVRRHASLEFVRDGDVEQFKNDVLTLCALLEEVR